MGTSQLVDRSAGQVILATFWNDIHAALEGDLVGRDVSGNPVSGNNLGTGAYPWGTIFGTSLFLNGSAVSTSQLESDSYKIVSGRKRSSSNQPCFIVPAGAAATFDVKGGTTPLSLSIKGTAATISTNITKAIVTAPASNNTCLVNDALAVSQAETRVWGERYNSYLGPSQAAAGAGQQWWYGAEYPITVDAMGSSVSARVGTVQAFKVGSTEYFLAYIDSTTQLSRCHRGYFFDSTDAPIKRLVFADNATITLMNLGYVFADVDGVTIDVIFTGAGVNSTPVYSYTTPASPVSGDYWFDITNQQWKRHNGSSFVSTNRMLIGMVVADTTNCVAARSFDFWTLNRSDNTLSLVKSTSSVLTAKEHGSRINVMGNRIHWGTSLPSWSTSTSLAAAADMYDATLQASRNYYAYVTDEGLEKISDIQPYFRPDLLGFYHPYQPWRCVGFFTTDSGSLASEVNCRRYVSGRRPDVNIIIGDSQTQETFSTANTYTSSSRLQATITTDGGPVRVRFQPQWIAPGTPQSGLEIIVKARFKFQRNGVDFHSPQEFTGTLKIPLGGLEMIDFPPPGTHVYTIWGNPVNGGGVQSIYYAKMIAEEIQG